MVRRLESVTEARLMGLHSNIPKCCVEWYVKAIIPVLRAGMLASRSAYPLLPAPMREFLQRDQRWQYWPCPECFAARRVQKLHICTRRCAKPFRRIARIGE